MRKLLLVALVSIFATQNARAKDGEFFVGGGFPIVGVGITKDQTSSYYRWWYDNNQYQYDKDLNAALLNLAFGYSYELGERLGLRYYGSFYYANETINADFINVDVLFNVVEGENAELRLFAVGWLGCVIPYGDDYYYDEAIKSFDLGLNAGLRFVLAQRHGFDFYGRFGFLPQGKEATHPAVSWKIKQPYSIGLRYSVSF